MQCETEEEFSDHLPCMLSCDLSENNDCLQHPMHRLDQQIVHCYGHHFAFWGWEKDSSMLLLWGVVLSS